MGGLWLGSPHELQRKRNCNRHLVHPQVWPSKAERPVSLSLWSDGQFTLYGLCIRAKSKKSRSAFGGTNCVERCSYHPRQSWPNPCRLRDPMFFLSPCSLCAKLWCWAQRPTSVSPSLSEWDSGAQKHQIYPKVHRISSRCLFRFIRRICRFYKKKKNKFVFPFELI